MEEVKGKVIAEGWIKQRGDKFVAVIRTTWGTGLPQAREDIMESPNHYNTREEAAAEIKFKLAQLKAQIDLISGPKV